MNAASTSGGHSGLIIDKTCRLLRAGQPLVWALAVVFGLLGVTLIVRYLWRKQGAQTEEQSTLGHSVASWMQT